LPKLKERERGRKEGEKKMEEKRVRKGIKKTKDDYTKTDKDTEHGQTETETYQLSNSQQADTETRGSSPHVIKFHYHLKL
jgi:hypothetical protein